MSESLPNITGNIDGYRIGTADGFTASGAFIRTAASAQFKSRAGYDNTNKPIQISFSASDSSSVYQDDAHVIPLSCVCTWLIRY